MSGGDHRPHTGYTELTRQITRQVTRLPTRRGTRRARHADAERRGSGVRLGPRAAALLAGALPALAFPAPSLWWLGYVALVPWLLLIRSAGTTRRAALDGWIGGIGFIVAVHHWLVPSLHVFIVLLAALVGLLWAPWGVLVQRLLGGAPSALRAAAAVVAVPSGWLVIELVRSWEGLGGPWGLLGASQWEVAPALRVASVGGVWLVSLLVVAVNTALVLLTTARTPARTTGGVLLVVCALAVGGVWAWAPQPVTTGTARIAVVQPGVVAGPGSVERRLARGEELTRTVAGRDVDLVVWGESSIGRVPGGTRGPLGGSRRSPGRPGPTCWSMWTPGRRTDRAGAESSSRRCSWVLTGRPGTGTTRCAWCRSVSTSRRAPCSAGRPPSARRRARTGCAATGRW
ncbi:hypothetical protein Smic_06670 [Streptomyces microflavus]|uniref:Apolipoprotein N-acyltransferase N-terminal domain-containing protein n=1 Tax=Streptomyces microflavus TaxID=1919 RepID=A0A7J0CHY7_STRMI|nr:hypothetical protein Smic_06670 [Streptomyces microflavus]